MFKLFIAVFAALLAVAISAPKPGIVASPFIASAPVAYSAGFASPLAYSAAYTAPLAYSSPLTYTAAGYAAPFAYY